MVESLRNWRRRCGIPAAPSSRNRSTSSSSWLGKILQRERFCSIFCVPICCEQKTINNKTSTFEDASKIMFNFVISNCIFCSVHSLTFFPSFSETSPTPLPCRSVGTFARALDCSSSVRQPSLHMSAAAASRDITLVRHISCSHSHTLHTLLEHFTL